MKFVKLSILTIYVLVFCASCSKTGLEVTGALSPVPSNTLEIPSPSRGSDDTFQVTMQAGKTQNAAYSATREVKFTETAIAKKTIEALTPSPTPKPSPVVIYNARSTLPEWSLNVGNYWVYDVLVYSYEYTATYIITDTVVETKLYNDIFIAQVQREERLAAGNPDVLSRWFEEPSRWYFVIGNSVYKSYSARIIDAKKGWLEYIFPLSSNCWYPSYQHRMDFNPQGCNKFGSGIVSVAVPAGNFNECIEVIEQYLGGGIVTYFCNSIGVVAEDYDHVGTPYGYHVKLVSFDILK